MKLKRKYATKDEIPSGMEELYTEQDGAFVLTGVEDASGSKTDADVQRLNEALRKEREDHKGTKAKLRTWGERTPESVEELESQVDELKARLEAGGGKMTDDQLDAIVEKRLPARTRPIQRELEKTKAEKADLEKLVSAFTAKDNQRLIVDSIRDAARGDKKIPIADVALPDVEILAERVLEVRDGRVVVKDDAGYTPGITAREWLVDVQTSGKRPHWFIQNVGAGANGGDNSKGVSGENPFAKDTFNVTQIGQLVKTDPQRAKRLAVAAKRVDLLPAELRG